MDATPLLTIWRGGDADGDAGATSGEGLELQPCDRSAVRTVTEKAKQGQLASASGDPNDLRLQRWGVVLPEGRDDLLDAVKDLCALRAEQQGEEAVVYRVKPAMTTADAEDFVDREYWDKVGRDARRLPQYLLLLGDADGVSWQLQQTLARHGVFPGRLALGSVEEYGLYAAKVKRWEAAALEGRDALFYAVNDPSSAVVTARSGLLAPAMKSVSEAAARGDFGAAVNVQSVGMPPRARPDDELAAMLDLAASARGAALATVSHGIGIAMDASAKDLADRRARQGALAVSPRSALFAERVAQGPFLPGGAWLFFACFSAGTPAESAYAGWLRRLDRNDLAQSCLSTLVGPAEAPFAAALPRAALANPEGPLAVIGHVDLAWSWSYSAVRDGTGATREPRAERFAGVLSAWLRGDRFGPSHRVLSSAATSVGERVLSRNTAAGEEAPPGADWQSETSYLWLEYQDLNGHVLLGDPAAALPGSRLSARKAPPAAEERPVTVISSDAAAEALDDVEDSILRYLSSGGDTHKLASLAKRLHIAPDELKQRADLYRAAGRKALSDHLSGAPLDRRS